MFNIWIDFTSGVYALYDPTQSVNSGVTVLIKPFLWNGNKTDVSPFSIFVYATGLSSISGFSGDPEDYRNPNLDNHFRLDVTLGPRGGYNLNLRTKGLPSGSHSLLFKAGNDPAVHAVLFGVK